MIDAARMRALMAEKEISQNRLADLVGVRQGTISKILGPKPGGSAHIARIARHLGTTAAYLEGETDDPSAGAIPVPSTESIAEQLDLVMVHEVDLQYGFGAAFVDGPVDSQPIAFPRAWLKLFTPSPAESLFFARGRGDSMMPTLLDGDIVLIDRAQDRIGEQDLIWALGYGEMASIKRVRRTPKGEFRVISDNPIVPDEVMIEDELFVVGRVVWVGRKM